MANTLKIAIIGAGIAGLSCALAFAKRGHDVGVYEQAPALAEVGAGLQISPNGMAVLAGLGLQGDIKTFSQPIDFVQLTDGLSDKLVVRMAVGGSGHGYGAFHRADLVQMLFNACLKAGVSLSFGAHCLARDLGGFDLVVGADGIHSLSRADLNGAATPEFTGHVAWRAVIKAEPRFHTGATVAMGPGRHVVSYPLRAAQFVNVVGIEERSNWAIESWSAKGHPVKMREVFKDFGPETCEILARVEVCHEWGLFRHPVAPRWHDGKGMALIGDAAHPTLPFMAQGANLALEDAWVLADLVSMRGLKAGLPAYQAARETRVARALAAAQANAKRYHLANPLARKVAHMGLAFLGKAAPGFLPSRFDWLYGHDVTRHNQG